MKKITFSFFFLLLSSSAVLLGQNGRLDQSFQGVQKLKISTVSGDCIVTRGGAATVNVSVEYTYDSRDFEPQMQQNGSVLELKERFYGNNVRGESIWYVQIPDGLDVKIATASGNLEVTGVAAALRAVTASGNVTLTDVTGDVEATTASGNLKLDNIVGPLQATTASGNVTLGNSDGAFTVTSASGDIRAHQIRLGNDSKFSAASGDVNVALASSPDYGLKVATASGDVTLNFGGNSPRGQILVRSPEHVDFQSDFHFQSDFQESGGERYRSQQTVIRTADFGGSSRIEIGTASGRIQVRKN